MESNAEVQSVTWEIPGEGTYRFSIEYETLSSLYWLAANLPHEVMFFGLIDTWEAAASKSVRVFGLHWIHQVATSLNTYAPGWSMLKAIAEIMDQGRLPLVMIHTHPMGCPSPSLMDKESMRIMRDVVMASVWSLVVSPQHSTVSGIGAGASLKYRGLFNPTYDLEKHGGTDILRKLVPKYVTVREET